MIELSSRVAATARFLAELPRRGAGSLGQRPAPAPSTLSHGAPGAPRGPDPLPLADRLWGLPGREPRNGGCAASGRVPVCGQRPARPLRLQVPQPADHAHLRLLPALPGTQSLSPAWDPPWSCRRGLGGGGALGRKVLAQLGRPIPAFPRRGFYNRGLELSPPASSLLEKPTASFPSFPFPRGNRKASSGRGSAVLCISRVCVYLLVSRDLSARDSRPVAANSRALRGPRRRKHLAQVLEARLAAPCPSAAGAHGPTLLSLLSRGFVTRRARRSLPTLGVPARAPLPSCVPGCVDSCVEGDGGCACPNGSSKD
jgi:hypothetical protein